jgi:copper homeostasis protein
MTLELSRRHDVDVFPMVRCRPGSFVYSDSEKVEMIHTATQLAKQGVSGIVIGALTDQCQPDYEFLRIVACRVREINPTIEITFHKAIDQVVLHEMETMTDVFRRLSPYCSRVLTSGGCSTALEGAKILKILSAREEKPLPLVAGKIRQDNVLEVVSLTDAKEVHSRSPLICQALGKPIRIL